LDLFSFDGKTIEVKLLLGSFEEIQGRKILQASVALPPKSKKISPQDLERKIGRICFPGTGTHSSLDDEDIEVKTKIFSLAPICFLMKMNSII
jgi:hypothetical protein